MLLPQISETCNGSENPLPLPLPLPLKTGLLNPRIQPVEATSVPIRQTLNEDEQFWWTTTGPILSRLLEHANYDTQTKNLYLEFYTQYVLPALGPRPRHNNAPFWRSFMTDDFSPIEYSWNFTAKEQTTVRFAIEPISLLAGTPSDPYNQIAPLQFLDRIQALTPEVDLSWFHTFADALYVKAANETTDILPSPHNHISQAFVGFDLNRQGNLVPKVYMMPYAKAAETGEEPISIITGALDRLRSEGSEVLTAWKVVKDYISSQPVESTPAVEFISFDCVNPKSPSARLKIYVRSPWMSLAVAKNMFTLGGRLVNEDTPKALDALEDLWRLSLGISGDVLEGEEVPPRDEKSEGHRTGGVIFNYEIKPGSVVPKAQMYIPVRHYAQNDMAIAEGVAAFFKKQGWQSHAESYVDSIRDIFSDLSLHTTAGTHTYISFAYKKDSEAYVSVYYSPRVF